MLMSSVLLLGLFLGGETASQDVRGTCADFTPAAACALRCPWDDSRDQVERQALEGSLEEDEEEDALPHRPSGAVAVFEPSSSLIDLLPSSLHSHAGSWNQPVRGPPRAV